MVPLNSQDMRKDTYIPEMSPKVESDRGNFLRRVEPLWASPHPRLVMHSKSFEYSISLQGQRWRLGRHRDNDIIVPDRWVSRHHALLERTSSGFSFSDLGSYNGSFVNHRRIGQNVELQAGDWLAIGHTELSFLNTVMAASPRTQPTSKLPVAFRKPPVVAVAQSAKAQGEIWREILSSQGVSVLWVGTGLKPTGILTHLQNLGQPQPDLLLIDIGSCEENPFDFCDWCRQTYPNLAVILTAHVRSYVLEAESRWAKRQGAREFFPGFNKNSLQADLDMIAERVALILEVLNLPSLDLAALEFALSGLQSRHVRETLY